MKLPRLLMLSLIFLLVFAVSAQAEWWKPRMPSMPNLNPFKKRDSHPANIGSQEEDSWQWPGMSKKPAAEPVATKPTMWQRVSSGTKNTWTKTKSTLIPWRAKPQPEEEIIVTGSNSSFSRMANSNGKQAAKKPYWAWGNDEEEQPEKASSVSDFIGGRRPD